MVQDQSLSIVAVSWTLGSLCIVIVGVRLYTRTFVTRQLGWDDFFIALSLLSAIVCSALAQVAVYYGLGMHTSDISDPDHRVQAAKYTVIAPNFSVVMVSIIWNVFAIIVIIGFCRPAKKIWLPDTPGSCFSLKLQLVGGTSQAGQKPILGTDVLMLTLALVSIQRLRRPLACDLPSLDLSKGSAGQCGGGNTREMHSPEKLTGACGYNMVLGPDHNMVLMYVIIICATLPTLPQAYVAIFHRRPSYYDSSTHRSGKSEPKPPPIRLRRLPDASLFETVAAEERGSSQENILDQDGMRIQKATEVRIVEESRDEAEAEDGHDRKYFPRQNPFRGSKGVPL
ncbi:uncharacterized protein DSM5745_06906 [Aspergillus mulundensis]|uniref:Rhodopsin domain-containing protein n=1 Tax=Aspergillus mulundensis TaxID=1810919 RepID=A0A3D8RK12_9EURO|nr:hypothetical protein DSM5745_06906 [Aspergillus mulundensis]RDW74244.1 hypothetical protein DSM5745_06906 [Aspergillus mulundensis]